MLIKYAVPQLLSFPQISDDLLGILYRGDMLALRVDCWNVDEVYNHAFISCRVPARQPGLYRRAGNRLRGFMKGCVAGPETLGAKRIVFDSHSLLRGLCNSSPFVIFYFFPSAALST